MPVDTSSYGVAPIGNPVDAFSRAFAQAQQARLQQESTAGLEEQRKALAAERQQRADALDQAAKLRAATEDAIRRGGGVRGATLAAAAQDAPGALQGLTEFFDKSDKSAAEIKKLQGDLNNARLDHLGHLADGVLAHGATPDVLKTALALYSEQFPDDAPQVAQLGARLSSAPPEQIKSFLEQQRDAAPYWQAQQGKAAERGPVKVSPGDTVLGPDNKPVFTAPEKVTHSPALTEYNDAVAQGYKGSFQQYSDMDANRRKPVTTITNAAGASNAKEAVAGMKDGTIPPLLPGRASKEYVDMLAEAHRQGYDLAGAATDWTATQKHIATMNGSQQLRLNQSINALPEMLDSVESLSSQWKGGKFPVLNSVTLKAAKGGLYGDKAASIANKLDAQIADVTADLGNVYMGGNSPTDEALKLAGKSLNSSWDEKVLHDMVGLARQNVKIRSNSIKNTGVAGASADNPYMPKQNQSDTSTIKTSNESLEHRVWRVRGKIGPEPK